MTKLKGEKGAITMITLISVLFLVSFLISTYIIVSNKVKTQKEILAETREIYEPKGNMEEIYNSYFSNEELIPIYTNSQLLAIGKGEKINIDEKIYTFSSDKVYVLKNNLEFSAEDLGLETDWIPIYNSENFEWNGHTIKETTLNGNVITYSGDTITGYPIFLADTKESILADYKIYGNSIQNGTPSPSTPIEIQSVGDEANLFNFNMIKNTSISSGIANYDDKTITIPSTNNLCIIGESFTGSPIAYEKFNKVINITEPGYYCLKFKVNSETTNIEPRANYGINIIGNKTLTVNPATTTFSNGYYFVKYIITDEIIQTIKESRTYRMYLYAFRNKDTLQNVDVTLSEFTFLKGDYTIDTMPEYGEYGKYRMPVKVSGDNGNEQTFNIYLDEPLRKVDNYVDYIDFANKQIVRNVEVVDNTGTLTMEESYQGLETPKIEHVELPEIQLYKGISTINVDTDVQPSNMYITYNVKQ